MSDFVEENSRSRLCFDWIKPVASSGSTSECYIPESLVTLERGVFWNCALKEITIPKGVTSMGEYLFFGCDSLKNIYNHAVEPQNVPPIHRNPKQITLHVPEQSVEAYRKAYFWKEMNVVPL